MKRKHLRKIAAVACTLSILGASVPLISHEFQETGIMLTASAAETGTVSIGSASYTYEISNGGILSLKSVVSQAKSLEIPSKITVNGQKYDVKEIGDWFLNGNKYVESLTIPETVTKIGGYVASSCSKLQTLKLSKNVKSIGASFCLFSQNLSVVDYSGAALEEIDGTPFEFTKYFDKFNNKGAVTLGDWIIRYDTTRNETSINISSFGVTKGVKKIGPRVFASAKKIQRVNLAGVTHVEQRAFSSCSNLKEIRNADSLVSVREEAFAATEWLNKRQNSGSVILGPMLIKYVPSQNETNTKTIDLSSATYMDVKYTADRAFNNYSGFKTLIVRSDVENITDISLAVQNTLEDVYVYDVKFGNQRNLKIQAASNSFSAAEQKFLNTHYKHCLSRTPFSDGNDGIVLLLSKWHLNKCGIKCVGNPQNSNYDAWEQYLIARKIYKYIGKTVKYEYESLGGSGSYGEEIVTHKGLICQLYSELYQYWLGLAGVKSEVVFSATHAWNIIKIGNVWFNADSCWNSMGCMFMTTDATIGTINHHKRKQDSYAKCVTEMGDVNRDGHINPVDASLAMDAYSFNSTSTDPTPNLTPLQLVLADVNMDGYVDACDSSLILGYYSKVSTGYKYSLQQYMSDEGIHY